MAVKPVLATGGRTTTAADGLVNLGQGSETDQESGDTYGGKCAFYRIYLKSVFLIKKF